MAVILAAWPMSPPGGYRVDPVGAVGSTHVGAPWLIVEGGRSGPISDSGLTRRYCGHVISVVSFGVAGSTPGKIA